MTHAGLGTREERQARGRVRAEREEEVREARNRSAFVGLMAVLSPELAELDGAMVIRVTVLVEDAPGLLVSPRIVDDALQSRELNQGCPGHRGEILQQVHRHAD